MSGYFILVILLTIWSRVNYNRNLPVVATGYPEPGAVRDESGEKMSFDDVIPAGALRRDEHGYFVFALEKKESALGDYSVVSLVSVEPMATDEDFAAVIGIPEDMPVVEKADDIQAGMRVRPPGE